MIIYWFKDKGLFSGPARNIGYSSYMEVEHACDAMINEKRIIVKNREGGLREITHKEVGDLYVFTLAEQLAFFKGIK